MNNQETAELKINTSVISQLGKRLYTSNMRFVILRELIQNSIDSGATKIKVMMEDYLTNDYSNTISVTDNGCGMNKDEILNTFLTLGGSQKYINNPIGGFGLAKMAIFSCDDFCVSSKGFALTKEILMNGEILLEDKKTLGKRGTTVKVKLDDQLFSKDFIVDYLQLINNPNVHFFFFDDEIFPCKTGSKYFEGDKYLYTDGKSTRYFLSGCCLTRVNGFPVMYDWPGIFQKLVPPHQCLIFDIETNLTPYDKNYPLNSTRESIVDTDLLNKYNNYTSKARIFDRVLLEEEAKKNIGIEFNDDTELFSCLGHKEKNNEEDLKILNKFSKFFRLIANNDTYTYSYGFAGSKVVNGTSTQQIGNFGIVVLPEEKETNVYSCFIFPFDWVLTDFNDNLKYAMVAIDLLQTCEKNKTNPYKLEEVYKYLKIFEENGLLGKNEND